MIQDVYAQFETLGIPTVGSSRIKAYRDVFISLDRARQRKGQLTQKLAEKVLHTIVEFAQLQTILKAARTSNEQESWQCQLRKLISGPGFSTKESKHSAARDFQFECLVAAISELSTYFIQFNEPDVLVKKNNKVFGIAAKRIQSLRKVEANCRKGAQQVIKSGIPGVIALDLSFALYPNQCINTNALEGALRFVEIAANKFVADHYKKLETLCRDQMVLGVLVNLQLPVLNFGHEAGPQLATAVRWTLVPFCSSGDERLGWILQFADSCRLGILG